MMVAPRPLPPPPPLHVADYLLGGLAFLIAALTVALIVVQLAKAL